MNAYDKLYTDMKNRFTVVNNNQEYSLGDYMLMKAGSKKQSTSNLPAVRSSVSNQAAVTTFFRYVNDKLTVKNPPAKDKTIRAFPFRTSCAAFLSAILACSVVITFGLVGNTKGNTVVPSTVEATEQTENVDAEFTYQHQ